MTSKRKWRGLLSAAPSRPKDPQFNFTYLLIFFIIYSTCFSREEFKFPPTFSIINAKFFFVVSVLVLTLSDPLLVRTTGLFSPWCGGVTVVAPSLLRLVRPDLLSPRRGEKEGEK